MLCEKPFSAGPRRSSGAFDARRLGRPRPLRRRSCGATIRRRRSSPELVAEGAIGRLRVVRAAFSFQLADVRTDFARFAPELDGGSLMDVGCYCVSAIRLLAASPARPGGAGPRAERRRRRVRGGAPLPTAWWRTSTAASCFRSATSSRSSASEGRSSSTTRGTSARRGIELRRDGEVEQIQVAAANSYQLELENMGAAVRGEAPLLLGRADALGQARTLEALYRSAEAAASAPVADWSSA